MKKLNNMKIKNNKTFSWVKTIIASNFIILDYKICACNHL